MDSGIKPRVMIFAGANGAGKSTHAEPILKALGISTFVNADYIARGLSGLNTESVNFEAGRIMLKRLHDLADAKEDFAFESTLSSRTFAFFLRKLKAEGYSISIFYFTLSDARLAYRRVRHRVKLGGHDIPQKVITRRFYRSLNNFFNLYLPLADTWIVFDNSTGKTATSIAWYINNQTLIKSQKLWKKINHLANQQQ
ncbi:MAG TPA: zeta toxin family protein [Methylotenera sp.]|nr:zeta toxin family protein [Methylotenera sp.]HPH06474.1 zeta toxin family protein [Methylotenera sp.]HPN01235.1 zeta toxin family protein [Methylotenera sp.]